MENNEAPNKWAPSKGVATPPEEEQLCLRCKVEKADKAGIQVNITTASREFIKHEKRLNHLRQKLYDMERRLGDSQNILMSFVDKRCGELFRFITITGTIFFIGATSAGFLLTML